MVMVFLTPETGLMYLLLLYCSGWFCQLRLFQFYTKFALPAMLPINASLVDTSSNGFHERDKVAIKRCQFYRAVYFSAVLVSLQAPVTVFVLSCDFELY